MAKTSATHTNERASIRCFIEGAIPFAENFNADFVQTVLRRCANKRAEQCKRVPRRTKCPNRPFEVQRRIGHCGQPARLNIDVFIFCVTKLGDDSAVSFI